MTNVNYGGTGYGKIQKGSVNLDELAADVVAVVTPQIQAYPRMMSTPPTIGASQKVASEIANGEDIAWNDLRMARFGGDIQVAGATYPWSQCGTAKNIGTAGWYLDFWFDGTTFELRSRGNGASAQMRVWVNGELAQLAPSATEVAGDGAMWFTKVTFASDTARRIRVELNSGAEIFGIRIGGNDSIWAPESETRVRMLGIGDSFAEGSGAEIATAGMLHALAWAMGWYDPWATGSGGSGFYAPGATGWTPPRVPFIERLDRDVFAYNPDRLVILGGLNDLWYEITAGTLVSVTQFSQRVADTFALIRDRDSALPVAQLGLMQPGGSPGVRSLQFRDALIQRCGEYGVTYIDNIGGPIPYSGTAGDYTNKGWVTGAGDSGSTQMTGNASRVTGPDSTHPTQYGHTYLGLRAATALRAAGWT